MGVRDATVLSPPTASLSRAGLAVCILSIITAAAITSGLSCGAVIGIFTPSETSVIAECLGLIASA